MTSIFVILVGPQEDSDCKVTDTGENSEAFEMQHIPPVWHDPETHLARHQPDHPILYFSPRVLHQTAARFQSGFPGLVTYAVKANAHPAVLSNLVAAGINAFDVASPGEMAAVRSACPAAVMHYNNPVRSMPEVQAGIAQGVGSWSVDESGL